MKVYPIYFKPEYFPNQYWDEKWAEQENKKAQDERAFLSQFCEQKLLVDKYGPCVYFEYNGTLDEFAREYGKNFVVEFSNDILQITLRYWTQEY